MKKKKLSQHGQALVLIALAVVGLVAFTALSIDGSRIFSNHRHSQNASDTAVLAAALVRIQDQIRTPTGVTWEQRAIQRAADNGYSSADGVTEVDTYLCSDLPKNTADGYTMTCKGLPTGLDPSKYSEYIYIHIKSVVPLYFAPVIGWRTYVDHTDAVAHAGVPVPTTFGDGAGIWVQHEGCKESGESDPFYLGGSGKTQVLGSGVLINSDCEGGALVKSGTASTLFTTKGACVGGTADSTAEGAVGTDITAAGGADPLRENCEPINPDSVQIPPPPSCTGSARDNLTPTSDPHTFIAVPGTYKETFPKVSGNDTVILTKGVYCIEHGIKVNAGVTLTTDFPPQNGVFDDDTEGVLFYLPGLDAHTDDINFNGGATVHIHAITVKPGLDPRLLNLLIYVNPDYSPDVVLSGNAGSTFTGTIFAPSSNVILQGNDTTYGGTVTLDSQIVSDTIKLTGNTDFTLIYTKENNATTLTSPDASLIE